MCRRIGRIGKLTGNKAAFGLRGKLLCLGNRALHALGAFGQNQLRTVCLKQVAAFDAHCLRHGENDLVASGRSDGCQANAGIAAGRLDNDRSGLQKTLCFRVVNHCLGDSVLDAAGGIEIFELCKDLGFKTVVVNVVAESEQRCSSDQVGDFVVNFHGG